MNRPIETIRLSQKAKDQLIKLKRSTCLMQWNVLCRWAFCLSLAEGSIPPLARIPADSSVEMTWKVFGGKYESLYLALLRHRCHKDGLGFDDEMLATQFRLHLHRGIGYLAADRSIRSLADLMRRIAPQIEETSRQLPRPDDQAAVFSFCTRLPLSPVDEQLQALPAVFFVESPHRLAAPPTPNVSLSA